MMDLPIRMLAKELPLAMELQEVADYAAYDVRHIYNEVNTFKVVRVRIAYDSMCSNNLVNIVKQLEWNMYDHGNGD